MAAPISWSSTTTGGSTTGTGPWDLTSTDSTFSILRFFPTQTFTFGNITNLTLNFNDILGGIGGGAPRLALVFTDSTQLLVNLGPPGSFTDPTLGARSSGNLVTQDDVGRYDLTGVGGSFYTNYDAAVVAAGGKTLDHISAIVDSFGGNNKELIIAKDGLVVAANTAVPEPATYGMAGAALVGLGLLRRRRLKV